MHTHNFSLTINKIPRLSSWVGTLFTGLCCH